MIVKVSGKLVRNFRNRHVKIKKTLSMCFGGDEGVLSWLGRLVGKCLKTIELAAYVSFEFDVFLSNVYMKYF